MAKAVTNKLSFNRTDMIPKGSKISRAAKIMVIQPFALHLDVLFKTQGEATGPTMFKVELALAKIVRDYTKKMGKEMEDLQKEVLNLLEQDKKDDDKAAEKAVSACSDAVRKLEGTLFDEMRDVMRSTVHKLLSKSSDPKFVRGSIETAGMSGFRNSRKAIYLYDGAFKHENVTDKSFGKSAVALDKAADELGKRYKALSTEGASMARAGKSYVEALVDFTGGHKELQTKDKAGFVQEFLQNDNGTFTAFKNGSRQFQEVVKNFTSQLNSVDKEMKGLDKILKDKKKSITEDKKREILVVQGKIQKQVSGLLQVSGAFTEYSDKFETYADKGEIQPLSRSPAKAVNVVANVDKFNWNRMKSAVATLGKDCDRIVKLVK